ncbi:dTDP-glucose 4,6-dehydratase [Candidatus Marinamargulisbacteria bacterium SCGC AG-343-D04]|nr:dTDP-glucose 4,6-dehydratase [Candidatus Marinamargulisbacteria bacterium SCGC AG-343-D04]
MKKVLVTGGAGFIGSHFIHHLLEHSPGILCVNLDKLTYASDLSYLNSCENLPNYHFVEGDICDKALIHDLFNSHHFDSVFHFAAESHVDNSIDGPEIFIDTNIKGTYNLIHEAKSLWMKQPHELHPDFKNARFHHVSTDEVYGSLGDSGFFIESTPYAPNSPYSASKASSDFIIRSYHHTFGMNVTISNCSNNFGPHQHDEKLIPTIIRNALNHNPIPIYGDGKNVRDWLYVSDHCDAILSIFLKGKSGETYNVGTRNEKNNLELCYLICDHLDSLHPRKNGSYRDLISFVKDRPGHDQRYAIDPSKLESELQWTAQSSFDTHLRETIQYYIHRYTCKTTKNS